MSNSATNKALKATTSDRYTNLSVACGMLMWNILLYYLHSAVAIVFLSVIGLFYGVRIYSILTYKSIYPIDGTIEKRVELAVSLIWLATAIIQSFSHVFPDWWRVTTFAVAGLVIGLNLTVTIRHLKGNTSERKKL